ncbi:hypothetical protein N5079_19085 [Planotetraspora sp. A-T 1434]|uniref:sigma factor n=1 Tax=Planotetraspora sp. A-T 1434 TaxID=2979219 RepID=UPI0021C01916|nr:sigma factor [Planotetraspora sp. A-T 1434]MCT9932310.1 hypothetical protein [Planotetraspora sp. A-T 1434]
MELLEAVRGGNTSAYGMLYQRHAVAARSLARQLVEGDEEVEDVLVETFARILDVIRRGGGPVSAFRPYLLTALRRYLAVGEVDLADPGAVYVDPELTGLERTPLARAYLSLPERWRMVLWHCEIESARPAEMVPLLGLSSSGVTALAERACEGLRQAYLQLHREGEPRDECRPILPKIAQHVEGALARRDAQAVDEHVAECIDCRAVFLELADVPQGLRVIAGQLVAGPAVDDYLAELARASEGTVTPLYGVAALFRRVPTAHRAVLAGAAVATLAGAAFIVVADPIADEKPGLPPGAGALRTPTPGDSSPRTSGTPSSPRRETDHPRRAPTDHGPRARRPYPVEPREALAKPRDAHVRPREASPEVTRLSVRRPEPAERRPALAATIDPVGALVRARPGIIGVRLRNTGTARSREVEAAVALPTGVTLSGHGSGPAVAVGTVDGWACRTAGRDVRCGHGALAPGQATTVFLRVAVAADAPTGRALDLRVRSGGLQVAARSAAGVRASGAAARFAADGRVTTRAAGNTLLTSSPKPPACAPGAATSGGTGSGGTGSGGTGSAGSALAVPVDLDGDPSTRSSSCARLDLPAGSRVLWAGLYWSATGRSAIPAGDIRVKAPGARRYATVHAAEVVRRDLPTGAGYQAFADVTSLAGTAGGGRWWAADPSMRWGESQHAGWSLVVMVGGGRQPYGRAAVLDTATVVDGSKGPLKVPLDGLSAAPARIDLVLWNGATGGSVTLSHEESGIAGYAAGVAVGTFHTVLGRHPVLRLTTRDNTLLFGVAAVSARSWS